MSRLKINRHIAPLLALIAAIPAAQCQQHDPLQLAATVARGVIRDTRFALSPGPAGDAAGLRILDFRIKDPQTKQETSIHYSFQAAKDTVVQIGVQGASSFNIWLNDQQVYQQTTGIPTAPVEYAYGRFRFNHHFTASIKKGKNEWLIRCRYPDAPGLPVIFLRPQTRTDELDTAALFCLPESTHPLKPLPRLITDSQAVYHREPYADWSYPNGILMWSILQLGEATADSSYTNFVKSYTDFILQNKKAFQYQYDSLFDLRCSFYRLFRQTMLDDAGAPALPFLALQCREKNTSPGPIAADVQNYFAHRQPRLPDSTFCRPEPLTGTIWADDLFMSTPVLLYMARITGEQAYTNEAAKQTVHFQQYLRDPANDLFRHGWFSQTHQQAPVCWGRANGWIAWATATLLDTLPVSHPLYNIILENFRRQMNALAKYQTADGMWRQVLDDPSSYEETSCTALFALAMARGVRKHWLSPAFREKALKAWDAVAQHITTEGTVKGICRGTEIGPDPAYYNKRATYDNDPRGLGAVIAAGIEIAKIDHR